MKNKNGLTRRRFITNSAIAGIGTIGSVNLLASCAVKKTGIIQEKILIV